MARQGLSRRTFFTLMGKTAGAVGVGAVAFSAGARAFAAGSSAPLSSVPARGASAGAMPSTAAPVMASSAEQAKAKRAAPSTPKAGADVAAYFGDVAPGAQLGRWKVVAVHDVHMGAVPVVLATRFGKRFQVDVLRKSAGGARGVAETGSVALFLSNGGRGSLRTSEEQGRGALALAAALASREQSGACAPALLSHADRSKRHPNGGYRVQA